MATITNMFPRHRRLHGVLCALTLLLACRSEPYPLEGVLTGELPDQDLDVEAELADPGEEMHEPLDDGREYSALYCTPEEIEEHRKSVTQGTHVNDEGLVCPKRPTGPTTSPTPAPRTTPSADPRPEPPKNR